MGAKKKERSDFHLVDEWVFPEVALEFRCTSGDEEKQLQEDRKSDLPGYLQIKSPNGIPEYQRCLKGFKPGTKVVDPPDDKVEEISFAFVEFVKWKYLFDRYLLGNRYFRARNPKQGKGHPPEIIVNAEGYCVSYDKESPIGILLSGVRKTVRNWQALKEATLKAHGLSQRERRTHQISGTYAYITPEQVLFKGKIKSGSTLMAPPEHLQEDHDIDHHTQPQLPSKDSSTPTTAK
jgi:hypothetical protein